MRYQKPSTSIQEQIAILQSRGLIISSGDFAYKSLECIGYLRLAGYALPFQSNYNADGSHTFRSGVRFEEILDLYIYLTENYDFWLWTNWRKLRSL